MCEDDIDNAIEDITIGVYVKEHATSQEAEDIGVVIEERKVLQGLDNMPLSVTMLFGLTYALNLRYPANLRYTFEAIQNILMNLMGRDLPGK